MIPAISSAATAENTYTVNSHALRHQFVLTPELDFKPVTPEIMPVLWRYLTHEDGRTCDFSYGGLLIWTPVFNYEYAIYHDTLFIKGRLEGDMTKEAFSLPLGQLSIKESFSILDRWCKASGKTLRFSAIPEYAIDEYMALEPKVITEQPNWADYMYDINMLATLSGKKMAKKRNHVNKFEATYPNHEFKVMSRNLIRDARDILKTASEEAVDNSESAQAERQLCETTLSQMEQYSLPMIGGILYVDAKPVAFTIGDVKHDTLYIHIEKADRGITGAYEAINKYFAQTMLSFCPSLKYINREDDAGSPGLRFAKESYHPIELLKKFDIIF